MRVCLEEITTGIKEQILQLSVHWILSCQLIV